MQRRHVDWVLSDANTEWERVAPAPYCKSRHEDHKEGRNRQKHPPDSNADLSGMVEKSRIGQGDLQILIWVTTQI